MDKELILKSLIKSGWYEGRDCSEMLKDSIMYKILPEKVKLFFNEFAGITIEVKNFENKLSLKNNSFFNNIKIYNYYKEHHFEMDSDINFNLESDEIYYYSTLVGYPLYGIAHFDDYSEILMDELNNFYLKTSVGGQLIWFSNKNNDFVYNFYFGLNDLVLNEDQLKWMSSKDQELEHLPPINKKLIENPW